MAEKTTRPNGGDLVPRHTPAEASERLTPLLLRGVLGGTLMGLANLVPGISGGTMLLAAGIYPRFISAVAEVTTLRFRSRSLLVLVSVVVAAGAGILLLAGPIKTLVIDQRWIMYSLFVGLTLGGLPLVWRMARPVNRQVWIGATAGVVAMTLLALARGGEAGTAGGSNLLLLALAGLAGAGAMVLPGVSGGYLLLLLGQYVPILSAIDLFKSHLQAAQLSAALETAMTVLAPVGVGVLVGIVAISNLLRWLLTRFEKPTLGVLVGLLLGAVVGLWPFQETVPPTPGETVIRGQVVTEASLGDLDPQDYPAAYFKPSRGQGMAALGLALAGAGLTATVARVGDGRK